MSLLDGIGLGHHRGQPSEALVLAYGNRYIAACRRGQNAQGAKVYASMDFTDEAPERRAPVKGTTNLLLAQAQAGKLRSYASAAEAQRRAAVVCRAMWELDFYI